jgi:hypothetical protein
MKRNTFIKLLARKKYLFTDTGKNIIIHGVDPTKRLNSIQTYSEIDLSSINSIPNGVIFDVGVEVVRMENVPIDKIPIDTYFINKNVDILIGIPEKNTMSGKSRWTNNIDAIKVDGISPTRILSLLAKLNLFEI